MQYFSLSICYALTWSDLLKIVLSSRNRNFSTHNKRRTRISRWFGREKEENLARTRSCCGWPSSPRKGQWLAVSYLVYLSSSIVKANCQNQYCQGQQSRPTVKVNYQSQLSRRTIKANCQDKRSRQTVKTNCQGKQSRPTVNANSQGVNCQGQL